MAQPSCSSTAANNDSAKHGNILSPPHDAPAAAAAAAAQHDWEMLSMSMTASTFGAPQSASFVCSCDFCTGKTSAVDSACVAAPHPVSMLPQSLVAASTSADPNSSNVYLMEERKLEAGDKSMSGGASSGEYGFPMNNWPHQSVADHTGVAEDEGRRLVSGSAAEPFTDGWKPRRGNSPAHLIVDLAPATLRAFSDKPAGNVNSALFYKEFKNESNSCSVNKAVYTAEAGIGIFDATAEAETKLNLVEGEKVVKKKSRNSFKDRSSVAWWTPRACLWRIQARDANTLWSIALAASVVGIVVLGYRWQRERSQNQQLRMQICAQDEKIGDLRHQVTRLRDAITGRRHRL